MLSVSDAKLNYIIGFGFLLRLAALIFYPDQNFPDAQSYFQSGQQLFIEEINGGIISSTLHMPLYAWWSYLLGSWLKFSDILFSTASIYLIYQLTVLISKNKTAGLVAALIAAVYPYFIFYAVSRLTETSFVFFVLLAFYNLYKGNYKWASLVLVIAILIRPTFELLNPILIIAFGYKLPVKQNIKNLGIYGLIYLVLMAPWWLHNYAKYGEFVRLSLGFGHVLYSGNNPLNETGGGVVNDTIQELDLSAFDNIANPIQHDQALKEAAIKFIKENPERFLKLAVIKFKRFWQLWPFASEYDAWQYKLISLCSYGIVLLLSIVFVLLYSRQYFAAVLPIYLMFGYLTAVHMILIASIRYRFPLEPFMVIFSGIVISHRVKRIRVKAIKRIQDLAKKRNPQKISLTKELRKMRDEEFKNEQNACT